MQRQTNWMTCEYWQRYQHLKFFNRLESIKKSITKYLEEQNTDFFGPLTNKDHYAMKKQILITSFSIAFLEQFSILFPFPHFMMSYEIFSLHCRLCPLTRLPSFLEYTLSLQESGIKSKIDRTTLTLLNFTIIAIRLIEQTEVQKYSNYRKDSLLNTNN